MRTRRSGFATVVWLRRLGALGVGAIALFCEAACSTSSSTAAPTTGCNSDPIQCPNGQTCWPVDAVPNFACLPSQPSASFGAGCKNSIGHPTCGDYMACDATDPDASTASCTFYCDEPNGHVCPTGFACRATHVGSAGGPTIRVCRPEGPGGDGGSPQPTGDGGPTGAADATDARPFPQ